MAAPRWVKALVHRDSSFSPGSCAGVHGAGPEPCQFGVFYSSHCLVAKSYSTLCDPMDCSLPGFAEWDFPEKNTGVRCHFLLQRIFPVQGSNTPLVHGHVDSLIHWKILSHQGSLFPTETHWNVCSSISCNGYNSQGSYLSCISNLWWRLIEQSIWIILDS